MFLRLHLWECAFLAIATLIVLTLTFTIGFEWSVETVVIYCFVCIFVAFIFSIFIRILNREKKIKNEIKLWLEDAVLVKATSKKIGTIQKYSPRRFANLVKIRIRFRVGKKDFARTSEGDQLGIKSDGYNKIWANYADREIDVLYSPKYDQVIVLKD